MSAPDSTLPRVLHVASEVAPFSKTGGLADVAGALPGALRRQGVDAHTVTPLYRFIEPADHGLHRIPARVPLRLGHTTVTAHLWRSPDGHTTFVDAPGLSDRDAPYGTAHGDYPDNPLRFARFCRAAMHLASGFDLVHLHDWQAGLTGVYLDHQWPTVLTIHNLAYQGLAPMGEADALDVPGALRDMHGAEFHGQLSLLKAGLVMADCITTVSPGYAREIKTPEYGKGLDGLMRARADKVVGILNGLDVDVWDPRTDGALPAHYDAADLAGKAVCKNELQRELGLPRDAETPLLVYVGRAAAQKGLDLLAEASGVLATADAQLAVLCDGDRAIVDAMVGLGTAFPGRVAVRTGFSEALARRMYAGADFVLVPSRFEPCGLAQLIGMRYGAVPVVRRTGGLADTVDDGATGIVFGAAHAEALARAIERAAALYRAPDHYRRMQAAGLARDSSWDASARAWVGLYESIAGQ